MGTNVRPELSGIQPARRAMPGPSQELTAFWRRTFSPDERNGTMRFLSSPIPTALPLENKKKKAPKFKRKRLLVDPAFQFRLLLRVLMYSFLWTVVAFHFSFVLYVVEVVF